MVRFYVPVSRIAYSLPKDQRIFLTSVVSYDRFMKSHLLRSTGAILAGFLFVVVTSILTDFILSKTGIMKEPFHANPSWFIGLVILYRCLYGVMGSYLTAKLAPGKPMQHAMTGGLIGLVCYLGLVPFNTATLHFEGIVRRHLEIMTGAGIVAGVIYWMIAGRNAGIWRKPPPPLRPPPPLPSNSRPPD